MQHEYTNGAGGEPSRRLGACGRVPEGWGDESPTTNPAMNRPLRTLSVAHPIRPEQLRMIKSFRDRETEKVFQGRFSRRLPPNLQRVAQRKLAVLDAAERLEDLRVPPGNRLEKLSGDRAGQYSIRISGRWRVCFEWVEGDAYEVEIVDYHRG